MIALLLRKGVYFIGEYDEGEVMTTQPGYPYLVKLLRRDAAVYEDAGEGRLLFEEVLCVFQPEETFFFGLLGRSRSRAGLPIATPPGQGRAESGACSRVFG